MEEIKINDKTYVSKEDYDRLAGTVFRRQRGIMDAAKVMMFIELVDGDDWKGDNIVLDKPAMEFKPNGELDECTMDFNKEAVTTKAGTRISYEYVMMADKMVKAMTYKPKKGITKFAVYEGFDNYTNKDNTGTTQICKKDYPIMLVWRNYGFLIAPRVVD